MFNNFYEYPLCARHCAALWGNAVLQMKSCPCGPSLYIRRWPINAYTRERSDSQRWDTCRSEGRAQSRDGVQPLK